MGQPSGVSHSTGTVRYFGAQPAAEGVPQTAAGKARWRSGGELDRRRRGWRDGQLRAERVAAEGEREHPETSAYEDWPRGGEEAEMMTQKRA